MGNIKPFPKTLKKKLLKVQRLTSNNRDIQINMALNYGSRQEIISSIKKLNKKIYQSTKKIL